MAQLFQSVVDKSKDRGGGAKRPPHPNTKTHLGPGIQSALHGFMIPRVGCSRFNTMARRGIQSAPQPPSRVGHTYHALGNVNDFRRDG